MSTESGISDYRSKGGLWDRFTPVFYDEFLRDEEKRRLYWQRKIEMWPSLRDAQLNAGHRFFFRLHAAGKLSGLITQNIDGLHAKAGLPREKIVRIHGTNAEIICLSCRRILPVGELMEGMEPGEPAPRRGAALIIVTLSETPLDSAESVLIRRPIGEVAGELLAQLEF